MSRATIPTLATALLLLSGTAAAQGYGPPGAPPPPPVYQQPAYQPPPPPMYSAPAPVGIQRDGFVIGFSIGAGVLTSDNCADCESLEGAGGDFHVGFMVSPQLALLAEGYVVSHTENNLTLDQSMGTLAAQYWVRPNLWIKGGLGSGQITLSNDDGEALRDAEVGAAVMFAGGFEVYQGEAFAVDLALRVGAVSYEDADTVTQTAATVGFNWY